MQTQISIHAPLTGSDQGGTRCVCRPVYFNPRSPYGERQIRLKEARMKSNFNPRSPYGERLLPSVSINTGSGFQSTLPLRGATFSPYFPLGRKKISIHAPLTGSDLIFAAFPVQRVISIHAPLTGSDMDP